MEILPILCLIFAIPSSTPGSIGQVLGFPSKLYESHKNQPIPNRNQDSLIFSSSKDDPMTLTSTLNNTSSTKKLACRPEQTLYKGRCLQVLQSLPCPDGEWLIEAPTTGQGQCVINKCAGTEQSGYFKGQCVKIRSEEACPTGMRVYIDKSGQMDCDCKEGHIYNGADNLCYEAYRQGPCKEGNVFATLSTSRTGCKRNPCKIDGLYCNGPDAKCDQRKGSSWMFPNYEGLFRFGSSKRMKEPSKNCVKFGSPCTPQEGGHGGIFVIHPDTNQPHCQGQGEGQDFSFSGPTTRIIGNVPIFKCAPGSRRDILGNCRTPTIIDFS